MKQSPAPIATATRTLRFLSVATRLLLWVVLAAWGLFALSWGALHLWIVPRIGDWRPDVERWVSAGVGMPVSIGELQAESSPGGRSLLPALVPVIELRQVRLFDPRGQEALLLPRVRVAISVTSLWRLGVDQIVIESPVLDVRRTAQGRLQVAGLDLGGAQGDHGQSSDWFFDQPEFVIRQGTVRWTDELRDEGSLALEALDLVVRNRGRLHEFRLDATPPPDWGDRFSLRARLREPLLDFSRDQTAAPLPDWRTWSGELYGQFPRVDVQRLRRHVDLSQWDIEVLGGQGRVQAWADVRRGEIDAVTADLDLADVRTRLGAELPELDLVGLQGRMGVRWSADGFGFSSDDLRFRSRAGHEWPGGVIRVGHETARGARPASATLTAERIDLGALGAVAASLPLGRTLHGWLESLQPRGLVTDLEASWQADSPQAPLEAFGEGRFRARGAVQDLSLRGAPSGRLSLSGRYPLPGRPGISGAGIEFEFDQDGGRARVRIADGHLELPDVFEDPVLPMRRLETEARWRLQGERIEVDLEEVTLQSEDANGRARVRWRTADPAVSPGGSRFPGLLDLEASLSRADGTRVHRYLPLTVDPGVRRYLREAIRSAGPTEVSFRIQGDIWDMPMVPEGPDHAFRIGARFQDLDFDYVPTYLQGDGERRWPQLRQASGEFLLDRHSMRVWNLRAAVEGAPDVRLSAGEVRIDDLTERSVLEVSTQASGAAAGMLGYVQRSPVDGFLSGALAGSRMNGQARLDLKLALPLYDMHAVRIDGQLRFPGNDLRIQDGTPELRQATGLLVFSESGFQVREARAQVYGGELRFEGGLGPPGQDATAARMRFTGRGTATAEGLRDGDLGLVSRLFQRAAGATSYSADLQFRGGLPELRVRSDLRGLALDLPAPLDKTAEQALALRYENTAGVIVGQVAETDRLAIDLGPPAQPLVSLAYERSLGDGGPRVLRGRIGIGLEAGEALALPFQGVQANIRAPQIDADAWQRAFADTSAVVAPGQEAVADQRLDYLPTTLGVRADRLLLGGRVFSQVVAGGSRQGDEWRVNVSADQLGGYVAYRLPDRQGAGRVFARLSRLDLPSTVATDVEELLQETTSVPALDIEVGDFILRGFNLGRLELRASHQGNQRERDWRLEHLRLNVPEARLEASGSWARPAGARADEARTTGLTFRLDIDDSGRLLERFGQPGVVRGGQGHLGGRIGWGGSPLALDHASLEGQIYADIARGQFLKVDPGAARLLGVLNLQALPRRLALDFRDVFSEGFAFDFVRGDARIEQGVMSTNNLQMKGVNAAVLLEGQADIARETQDLKVVVVPEINAGTASLIATAINPVVGIGSFVAQFLLSQPLQAANTQEFRISGTWADPLVEKVQRAPPPALPAGEGGTAPPVAAPVE
ncbi:MAG: TIGR02099 family protein [Burkholderiales bacterium]|nr:MAG: TIGR02099 family protein [Burkholderiales bacterium]